MNKELVNLLYEVVRYFNKVFKLTSERFEITDFGFNLNDVLKSFDLTTLNQSTKPSLILQLQYTLLSNLKIVWRNSSDADPSLANLNSGEDKSFLNR